MDQVAKKGPLELGRWLAQSRPSAESVEPFDPNDPFRWRFPEEFRPLDEEIPGFFFQVVEGFLSSRRERNADGIRRDESVVVPLAKTIHEFASEKKVAAEEAYWQRRDLQWITRIRSEVAGHATKVPTWRSTSVTAGLLPEGRLGSRANAAYGELLEALFGDQDHPGKLIERRINALFSPPLGRDDFAVKTLLSAIPEENAGDLLEFALLALSFNLRLGVFVVALSCIFGQLVTLRNAPNEVQRRSLFRVAAYVGGDLGKAIVRELVRESEGESPRDANEVAEDIYDDILDTFERLCSPKDVALKEALEIGDVDPTIIGESGELLDALVHPDSQCRLGAMLAFYNAVVSETGWLLNETHFDYSYTDRGTPLRNLAWFGIGSLRNLDYGHCSFDPSLLFFHTVGTGCGDLENEQAGYVDTCVHLAAQCRETCVDWYNHDDSSGVDYARELFLHAKRINDLELADAAHALILVGTLTSQSSYPLDSIGLDRWISEAKELGPRALFVRRLIAEVSECPGLLDESMQKQLRLHADWGINASGGQRQILPIAVRAEFVRDLVGEEFLALPVAVQNRLVEARIQHRAIDADVRSMARKSADYSGVIVTYMKAMEELITSRVVQASEGVGELFRVAHARFDSRRPEFGACVHLLTDFDRHGPEIESRLSEAFPALTVLPRMKRKQLKDIVHLRNQAAHPAEPLSFDRCATLLFDAFEKRTGKARDSNGRSAGWLAILASRKPMQRTTSP